MSLLKLVIHSYRWEGPVLEFKTDGLAVFQKFGTDSL